MPGADREVELKFTLEGVRIDDLLAWLGQGRRPVPAMLRSVYYDTEDRALRRAGLSLRVREDGGVPVQTVKSAAAAKGRVGRGEWSSPITGPGPDLAAARRTPARRRLKRVEALSPLFTVTVERLILELKSPDSLIEAALDRGMVEAAGRSAPVVELELELKAGPLEDLVALARRLQLAFPAALSAVTKADRGFALVDGGDLAPRHFRQPALAPAMTTGQAFRVAARAALEQIVWNTALVRHAPAPAPEAIHQLRVGVRRLRATLSTFKPAINDDARPALSHRLRALGRALDDARNLDVFLDGAWRRIPAGSRLEADEAALTSARSDAHGRARAAVAGDEIRTLMLDVLAWIELGPWTFHRASGAARRDRRVDRFAARSLDKGRRRLIADGKTLAALDAEARHHVRIRVKALRYGAEILAPVFPDHPRRAARCLAALEALAETLGNLNDMATARVVVSRLPADIDLPSDDPRERRLIAAAERSFSRFRKLPPFWSGKT